MGGAESGIRAFFFPHIAMFLLSQQQGEGCYTIITVAAALLTD
jgi:hypothetical protein